MLINFPLFPTGYATAFDRITTQNGVYAFFPFRTYPDNPEKLMEMILSEIHRKKFADRAADLAPYYGITLKSRTDFSSSKKPMLLKALHNPAFRREILEILDNSLLFQSPLYVGKSKNIRARIQQHFGDASDLRERLSEAGYLIEKTSLLVLPLSHAAISDEETATHNDFESIAEEILSRLFHVHFTLRLG